jgi:putative transposase
MNTWRAGCAETCTSGSEGGPQKPTGRKTGRALRPDPYTEHPTREGKLYCAVVLDSFSRRVVGWSMADHLRTELVLDALDMAIAQRRPEPGLVHHSDHGCQGGFNRSSQYPEHRGCGWDDQGVGLLRRQEGRRCARRAGRR